MVALAYLKSFAAALKGYVKKQKNIDLGENPLSFYMNPGLPSYPTCFPRVGILGMSLLLTKPLWHSSQKSEFGKKW